MSEDNPYGGSGQPPGNYPSHPPGYPQGQPQRSDRWKIWLGIGLAIPALMVTGVLTGLVGAVDQSGAFAGITGLAGLVVPIVMLFFPATRKVGLGLLIGYAVLFVVLAGLCVALIASYS